MTTPHDPLANARLTGYERSGFAADYHAYRPRPPATLVDVFLWLAQTDRPNCVVDLGCGTGLSTGIWADRLPRVLAPYGERGTARAGEVCTCAPAILQPDDRGTHGTSSPRNIFFSPVCGAHLIAVDGHRDNAPKISVIVSSMDEGRW